MKTASHAILPVLCALCLAPFIGLAQTASLSGTISYDGRQKGDVWVLVSADPTMPNNLIGSIAVKASISPDTGPFTNATFVLPNLLVHFTYYLFAWRDSNTNGFCDAGRVFSIL